MRFFSTIVAGAAFVSATVAVSITSFPSSAQAGLSYDIKYDPANSDPTTLILRKGDSNNLANITTLTTSATGGTYKWTPDKGLVDGNDYALMIIQDGVANYEGPIAIAGGTGSVSSSASSSAASSTASTTKSASTSVSSTMKTTASAATASSSSSANGTVSSATLSATRSGSTASAQSTGASSTTTGGAPSSTGGASQMGSSMALVLGAVAAMAYLN